MIQKTHYKYALLNAVKHKGSAQSGAVVGVVMGSHPELRKDSKEIVGLTSKITEEVNSLSLDEQKLELEKLGVQETQKKKKQEKEDWPIYLMWVVRWF